MQSMQILAEDTIGQRIRRARQRKGWTQAELGLRSGLRESMICKYELGHHTPSPKHLSRIADALGVSVDYLLGRESEHHAR
jgi:transcriptional regulator with XRE-family HTH domain